MWKKRSLITLILIALLLMPFQAAAEVCAQHEWSEWKTTQAATALKAGMKTRSCSACGETESESIPKLIAYAKLNKSRLTLKAGKTYKLKVSMAAGDSVKKWKSSNRSVVTVTKKGKVKARRAGSAKVTVVLKSGKRATCRIRVKAVKKKSSSGKSGKSGGGSGTVFWTPGGSVYHSTRNCPTLARSRTIYSGSLGSCPKSRPCKVCH